MDFILLPKLTEKTLAQAEKNNLYTFVVAAGKGRVTKNSVGQYIHSTYKVTVEGVKSLNRIGKHKRFGKKRTSFQMPGQKLFLIKVKQGEKIPGFNLTEENSK